MPKTLSVDLRTRVLAAVAAGSAHRQAAERFGVSAASVSRWRNRNIRTGNVRPGPPGGDRNSRKTEVCADLIMACLGENRDATLFELRDALAAKGACVSKSALHRFLVRNDLATGMSVSAIARKFATSRQTIMRVRDEDSRSARP